MKARPSKVPAEPLVLYSFESSPYSKPVRARLCELEIPYLLKNTPKGAMTDMGPPVFRDKLFKAPKGTTRNRAWLADALFDRPEYGCGDVRVQRHSAVSGQDIRRLNSLLRWRESACSRYAISGAYPLSPENLIFPF